MLQIGRLPKKLLIIVIVLNCTYTIHLFQSPEKSHFLKKGKTVKTSGWYGGQREQKSKNQSILLGEKITASPTCSLSLVTSGSVNPCYLWSLLLLLWQILSPLLWIVLWMTDTHGQCSHKNLYLFLRTECPQALVQVLAHFAELAAKCRKHVSLI